MPDGSDFHVRGELDSAFDGMVTSWNDLTIKGNNEGGHGCESTDWEHGDRNRSYPYARHQRKKDYDLHGGQYGLKSCPVKSIFDKKSDLMNHSYVDNKLLDEYSGLDMRFDKSTESVIEKNAESVLEKDAEAMNEPCKVDNREKKVKILTGDNHVDVNKHSKKDKKSEKSMTKDVAQSDEMKKIHEAVDKSKRDNMNSDIKKERMEKLAQCKHVEAENGEKRDGVNDDKKEDKAIDRVKSNSVSLTKGDQNKSEDNNISRFKDEEEQTHRKTRLDPLSENVAEKQDVSKEDMSFSVKYPEKDFDHLSLHDCEVSYYQVGRTLDENSVNSYLSTDSYQTKQHSYLEMQDSISPHVYRKRSGHFYDKTEVPECFAEAFYKGDLKSYVCKQLCADNRNSEELELLIVDIKNLCEKFVVQLQKNIGEKIPCCYCSTDPQKGYKSFEMNEKVDANDDTKVDDNKVTDNIDDIDNNFVEIDNGSDASVIPVKVVEDIDNSTDTGDKEKELDTKDCFDNELMDESEYILDADEKDADEKEKISESLESNVIEELCPLLIEEVLEVQTAVNDLKGNYGIEVDCSDGDVDSTNLETDQVDLGFDSEESDKWKIEPWTIDKQVPLALYKLQKQMMELKMKEISGDECDMMIGMDVSELDAVRRNHILFCSKPEDWDQTFNSGNHKTYKWLGNSAQSFNNLILYTKNHFKDCFTRRRPNPKLPKSHKFLPKKNAGRRIALFEGSCAVGRQCADNGRRNNYGDNGKRDDKNSKNQRNKEDKNNNERNNNNNNNDENNHNNNNNNFSNSQTAHVNNDELARKLTQNQPHRSIEDVRVPDNDYKAYRKKRHITHDNFVWLEILDNELLEKDGASFSLFSVLTNCEETCVEICLSRPGDISSDALSCCVCMTVDSLLKHFTNCHSGYNCCSMCLKFFSLLCSHVSLCISKNGNTRCGIEICQMVIKMIPSSNLESHVKTLWFQVRKKFARIIGIVEVEDLLVMENPGQEIRRKPSLIRKPSGSGSGPLPSIPETHVIPSSSLRHSQIMRRKISQMSRYSEYEDNIENNEVAEAAAESLETTDHGVSGNSIDAEPDEVNFSRPEIVHEADAMPASSDEGSIDSNSNGSSGHSGVRKHFTSLPPAGPPCVGDAYFPSFQDRPTGIRGIGEVVYADRSQMLVVVNVWLKFKVQFMMEAKLAKHYREEGVILYKYKNLLKINKLRYNSEFQWIKSTHLGNGMTGKCHLAMDFETEFKFCVKEIHISNYEKDEIELMSVLDHEYVVQVYGAIRHAEKIYILQEFIEGGCLTEAINMQKKLGRRLSQLTALRYFQQLLQVLVYLKKNNILHEDIKADNILLDKNFDDASGPSCIKVTDFGMARRCQGFVQSGTKPVGTQTQWSPEKAEAVGYGYPAEVWAAICVLVHMLSGLPPWVRRYEEMKALILVIVDKSPPMEDIPRNILDPIKDLIRRGFTVCQGQRPTAETLLNHSAFQLLGESPVTTGTYSMLESVNNFTNSVAEATNVIEDPFAAGRTFGGAASEHVHNIYSHDFGVQVPAHLQELTVCPVTSTGINAGAASMIQSEANRDDSLVNSDRRLQQATIGRNHSDYDLQLLLTQSQHEETTNNNTETPVSAQPSQGQDPFYNYVHDNYSNSPNLPDLLFYQPGVIHENEVPSLHNVKPKVTIEDATANLIPNFDKIFESGESNSSPVADTDEEKSDSINDPEKALQHVLSHHILQGLNSTDTSNDSLVAQTSGSGSCEKEDIVESISSNIDDDDLFRPGPTENIQVTGGMKRNTHSEADLRRTPMTSSSGCEPQSAPPLIRQNWTSDHERLQLHAFNRTPLSSQPHRATETNSMGNSMPTRNDGYGRIPTQSSHPNFQNVGQIPSGQNFHNFPTTPNSGGREEHPVRGSPYQNQGQTLPGNVSSEISDRHQFEPLSVLNPTQYSPYSMRNPENQNFMTSTPASAPHNGARPKIPVSYPRELFPRDHNMTRYPGGNPLSNQPLSGRLPTSSSQLQPWPHSTGGRSYRQSTAALPQPRTPILNPIINPRAWLPPEGTRSPNLQLDIRKAQQGTDSPISSQVQTAPVYSPPKTPKKSPDLYRARSEMPTAYRAPSTVSALGSSPNDRLSTSTTKSQFEQQDAVFKELGRTAEDALSQHSDHALMIGLDLNLDDDFDDEVAGELDHEIIENPAESFAHLLGQDETSVRVTFISSINGNKLIMNFSSNYFAKCWRDIISGALDGFSRHDMLKEYGLTRFNLKMEESEDFVDLDCCLGNQSVTVIMTAAQDNDPWWIERGMIHPV